MTDTGRQTDRQPCNRDQRESRMRAGQRRGGSVRKHRQKDRKRDKGREERTGGRGKGGREESCDKESVGENSVHRESVRDRYTVRELQRDRGRISEERNDK